MTIEVFTAANTADRTDVLRQLSARREQFRFGDERQFRDANHQLRAFGEHLAEEGGGSLMATVYDNTVERFGYEAVGGVNAAWTGIAGWSA